MKIEDYKKIVKKNTPKEKRLKNMFIAFLVGGLICLTGEIVANILICLGISSKDATLWVSLGLIVVASLFTVCGFFDKWITKCQMGIIIPTTGFAHSITSAMLDYKKEGLVTGIGSNAFKLAGSVIVYGVVGAFLCAIGRVVFFG